jgi:hypothetical protein
MTDYRYRHTPYNKWIHESLTDTYGYTTHDFNYIGEDKEKTEVLYNEIALWQAEIPPANRAMLFFTASTHKMTDYSTRLGRFTKRAQSQDTDYTINITFSPFDELLALQFKLKFGDR